MTTIPTAEHLAAFDLINSSHVGHLAVSLTGEVLFANPSAISLLGASHGGALSTLFPQLWQRIVVGAAGESGLLITSLRKDESSYAVYVESWLREGEVAGYLCSVHPYDQIELLARHTKTFQEMSQEENAIINFSSDGLWICDAEARVVRMNPASERLNNVKAEDVIGKKMEELVSVGVFDKSVTLEVIKHKKVVSMLQKRGERSLLITGAPVFDTSGRLIRIVVSERDITEIEKLQRALEDQEALNNKYMEQAQVIRKAQAGRRTIIAKSQVFINIITQAIRVGSVDSTVLILGESGVGKGLIADLIHENSKRSEQPMVRINCGAIPESLIESELFGFEKGAFTGAQARKAGQFELADGGILFLDEVAELPLAAQVKLLRFLEDGCITRLGGTQRRELNVRVLAATHRDLEAMVGEGSFRHDLYYRLKVIPLRLPALRERRDCILPLVRYHLCHFSEKIGVEKRLSSEASDFLHRYDYPGNIRELINLCERLVVMTEASVITVGDLPLDIVNAVKGVTLAVSGLSEGRTMAEILEEVEERVYREAFVELRNQYRVAEALGVSQATVARRLMKYGIRENSAE